MMKTLLLMMMLLPAMAWAKATPEFIKAIEEAFPEADRHAGLVSAQSSLDLNKVHGYAVLRKSGIPAGEADWFITRQDYDYRPYIIKGDEAKTYFGKVNVYLSSGAILIISDVDVSLNTVTIKLLSKEFVVTSTSKSKSRAALALVFKFQKLDEKMLPEVLSTIQSYIEVVPSLAMAEKISAQLGDAPPPAKVVDKPAPKSPTPTAPVAVSTPSSSVPTGIVQAGMTGDQVRQILGTPGRATVRKGNDIWDYGDREIIFRGGKVYDMRWK